MRVSDDRIALYLEFGGLDCTKEAQAVVAGLLYDLRDARAALRLAVEAMEWQRDNPPGAQPQLLAAIAACRKVVGE